MRWNKKLPPQEGYTRIKTKFLLLPKCINNEWRWLEKVSYKQEYIKEAAYDGMSGWYYYYAWENIYWIDKEVN